MASVTPHAGINKLGFGYMRLPQVNGVFVDEQVNAIVDRFIELGFTYFDTANEYLGSEIALGKALASRHPRESFWISSKMMITRLKRAEQMRDMFETSLSRLCVDHLDAYFIHGMSPSIIPHADALDTWGYLSELKDKGLIKYAGTAYNGPPEVLDEILTKHPQLDIILLLINYIDWVKPGSVNRQNYEVIQKHGKLITVIEPLKGGLLASEDSEAGKLLKAANPDVSVASWAFRWILGLDGIKAILSGMGTMSQLEDNAKTFNNYTPLTESELSIMDEAVKKIATIDRIPCTSCNECAPHCPVKIPISHFINVYSDYLVYNDKEGPGWQVGYMKTHGRGQPVECTKCKACEENCPQKLPIMEIMETMERELGETSRKYVQITRSDVRSYKTYE